MSRRGPAVAESSVAAFEQRLGHLLPTDYRRFLLEVNGGEPDDSSCEFSLGAVTMFFSICDDADDSRDLEDANRWFNVSPSRNDLLFVAHDSSGANILLALTGEHRGQVWVQDVADSRPDGSNPRVLWHDRRDMKKAADSFDEFLRQLGPRSTTATAGSAREV
ncbi:MAG TPA: SMI1/KNR4 family protein [Kofleriaceae bacterium]|nr:SMI1/KNR4 family protein [Kofleriaceae bacterium]